MITQVLSPDESAIAQAARIIFDGGLVGFPTETVYGLGANALDAEAVKGIFLAKGRPGDNPLIVHITREAHVLPLIRGEIPPMAKRLMKAYWPGPMTLIFKKSAMVPDAVTAGLDTVAIRMPSHPVARSLIEACALPVAAPSGNRSGRPSPTRASHMLEDMNGRIPMILDGGVCDVGLESTVIDVTRGVPRVLRPGGITPEMIRRVCGAAEVDPVVTRPLEPGERPLSPGTKYRHYAPMGAVTVVHGDAERVSEKIRQLYDRAGDSALILALEDNVARYGERRILSLGSSEAEMAKRLFAALRKADELGAKVILSEAVEADGLGLAVMNRLDRAAAFNVIEV